MNRKMFAFDMDGTILNSKHELPKKTIKVLKQLKKEGHIILLASGRPYTDMMLPLNSKTTKIFDYLVANNGSYHYDVKKSKFAFEKKVSKKVVNEMVKVAKKNELFFAVHCNWSAYRAYLGDLSNFVKTEFEKKFQFYNLNEILEIINKHEVSQVSVRADKKLIKKISKEINLNSVTISIANEVFLDVNPKGVTKLTGINKIAKLFNIPNKDIIVFGDSGNDVAMLKGAGLGIAMSNGTIEAKKAANIVIGDNNSNSISRKLEEFLS